MESNVLWFSAWEHFHTWETFAFLTFVIHSWENVFLIYHPSLFAFFFFSFINVPKHYISDLEPYRSLITAQQEGNVHLYKTQKHEWQSDFTILSLNLIKPVPGELKRISREHFQYQFQKFSDESFPALFYQGFGGEKLHHVITFKPASRSLHDVDTDEDMVGSRSCQIPAAWHGQWLLVFWKFRTTWRKREHKRHC